MDVGFESGKYGSPSEGRENGVFSVEGRGKDEAQIQPTHRILTRVTCEIARVLASES